MNEATAYETGAEQENENSYERYVDGLSMFFKLLLAIEPCQHRLEDGPIDQSPTVPMEALASWKPWG